MTVKLALLLVLFPPCVLVPGFVAVRRFAVPDDLRLPLSVAISVALLYLAGFVLYLAGGGTGAAAALALLVLLAAAAHRRELGALLRAPSSRALLLHLGIFAGWLLLLTLAVRNYSGAAWSGDWEEHYQRALLFLGRLPLGWKFLDLWVVPSRPPLENVVVAFFMRLSGEDYAAFQLVAVLLASLEYLGAASLWAVLTRRSLAGSHAGLLVLTAFLSLNPSIVENATYPWTRALTNFFALQAAALYLVALRERDAAARRWSFLLLGLAVATHYSMGPYVVALAGLELWLLARGRVSLREAALAVALAAAPMAPWLAFAVDRFGVAGTFLTNSTVVMSSGVDAAGVALRTAGNLVRTLVPDVLRDVRPLEDEYLPSHWRDAAFLVYQVSLPALVGSLGGVAVAGLLAAAGVRRLRAGQVETTALAAAFLGTVVLLGVASVPQDDAYGVAHVCLQPLAAGGVVYLASRWRDLPRWGRGALGLALAADAALGIGLQFYVQNLDVEDLSALGLDRMDVSLGLLDAVEHKVRLDQPFLGELDGAAAAAGVLGAAVIALVILAVRASRGADRAATVTRDAEPA